VNKTIVMITLTLLISGGTFAQSGPPVDLGPNVMFRQSGVVGPAGSVGGGQVFLSTELPGSEKVISGAPYTATVSTEMSQVLGDGNRIDNKTTASLARDSQGRTRREETMGMVGPWQVNGPKLVFINDPTSQTNYVLDSNKLTATVLKHPPLNGQVPVPPMGASTSISASADGGIKMVYQGKGAIGDQPDEAKTESLGTETMEGVVVDGKRVTRTIPAGQIGNAQPIEIISEVWTSPDLQVVVMSKHSDPRFGETTYQLTGIQRAEPDHSLFEIPPGYTVNNMPAPMGFRMGTPEEGPVPFGVGVGGAMSPVGK
jgi:hypothetical protein